MSVPLFRVSDGTDLRGVSFDRGRYVSADSRASFPEITYVPGRIIELPGVGWSTRRRCAHLASAPVLRTQSSWQINLVVGLPAVALDGSSPQRGAGASVEQTQARRTSCDLHSRPLR